MYILCILYQDGKIPLYYAIENGYEAFKTYKNGLKLSESAQHDANFYGATRRNKVCSHKFLSLLQYMQSGKLPLHIAVECKQVEIVTSLLEITDMCIQGSLKVYKLYTTICKIILLFLQVRSPFYYAMRNGYHDIIDAMMSYANKTRKVSINEL